MAVDKRLDAFRAPNLARSERVSVAEQVAKRLLDLVRSGNLRPGDELPSERDLAAMMGVSAPSVREALRGLQILGVLKTAYGGRAFVSTLDVAELLAPLQFLVTLNIENVETLYQARVFVDGGMGRMAASRITDEAIERLRAVVKVQEASLDDPVAFRVADLEFHQIIIDACRNPFLDRIAGSLYTLGMEYRRRASETPGVIAQSIRDHLVIVEALASRDPDRTAAAMEEHLRNIDRSTRAAMKGLAKDAKSQKKAKGRRSGDA